MIKISEAAARHISKTLTKRGKGLGILVGTRPSGCSGLSYILEFVDEYDDSVQAFPQEGFTLFVPTKSLPVLEGMTLDYRKEGLSEGFSFDNPNVQDECGCGKSFKV